MEREVALRRGTGLERARLPAGMAAERIEPAWPARDGGPSIEEWIQRVLREPLGAPAGVVIPARASTVVVVPDGTRPAFLPRVLPALVEELERQGVERRFLRVAIASGAHVPPAVPEARELVGEVAARLVLHRHDAMTGTHYLAGRTRRGTPVELDDVLREAEAVITVAPVAWHYFAGFGGGPKLIFPGLASRRAAEANHALSLAPAGSDGPLHPGCTPGRIEGNPVADDLREAAAMCPVDYEIGFVNDAEGMAAAWSGPAPLVQQAAEAWLFEHAAVGEAHAYDVVLASAGGRPNDVNWIQAHKALVHACRYARPGGHVVLAADCFQGTGSPSFDEAMELPAEHAAARLRERFTLNGQTALSTRWHGQRCRVTLVTRLPAERVRDWGFEHAADLAGALRRLGPGPSLRIAWLPVATAVVPRGEATSGSPAGSALPRRARAR